MKRDFCIFCKSPLDGSDEHIMPQSVNGRLHSKELICHDCNSKFFGSKIDPVLKKVIDPILNVLGMDNAIALKTEDIAGREFLLRDGKTKPVKPIKTEQELDRGKLISISGDMKNSMKMFEKEAEKMKAKGKVLTEYQVSVMQNSTPFLRIAHRIEMSHELRLLLNKMAVEFYAYNNLDYAVIEELCKKIRAADAGLDNVAFCNQRNEIRDFASREVAHLILVKNDPETAKVFAYIEICNVLCCIVVLAENYQGEEIHFQYHQDVLTAERFTEQIVLKMTLGQVLAYDFKDDHFGYLTNSLMSRLRDREFNEVLDREMEAIKQELQKQLAEGTLKEEDFAETFVNRSGELFAELTVFEFPYILADQKDEENDDYNYIHSNFRPAIVEDFMKEHQFLLGKQLKTSAGMFTVKDFHQQKIVIKLDKELVTLYVVLEKERTGEPSYIKVKDFIHTINESLEKMFQSGQARPAAD